MVFDPMLNAKNKSFGRYSEMKINGFLEQTRQYRISEIKQVKPKNFKSSSFDRYLEMKNSFLDYHMQI